MMKHHLVILTVLLFTIKFMEAAPKLSKKNRDKEALTDYQRDTEYHHVRYFLAEVISDLYNDSQNSCFNTSFKEDLKVLIQKVKENIDPILKRAIEINTKLLRGNDDPKSWCLLTTFNPELIKDALGVYKRRDNKNFDKFYAKKYNYKSKVYKKCKE